MIQVKESVQRHEICQACGGDKNLVEMNIKRNKDVNGFAFCLCKNCIRAMYEESIKVLK